MTMDGKSLDGQVAMVTGGASGISRAMAGAFGQAGAHIWVADIDGDRTSQAVDQFRGHGINTDGLRLDVTDRHSVEDAVNKITEREGKIDILFNGAGIVNRQPVMEMSEEAWDRVLAINLKGTFLSTQAVAKTMIKHGYGRIINVASGQVEGSARNSNYAASKGGVVSFTKSFAIELRELKVDVTINAIAPGATDTPLWRTGRTREQVDQLLASGKIHKPEDMASVVVFLASADSWPLNGRVLARG